MDHARSFPIMEICGEADMRLYSFETDLMRYSIDESGMVISVFDKDRNEEHIKEKTWFATLYREHAFLERDIHSDPGRNYLYVVGPQIYNGAEAIHPLKAELSENILSLEFPECTIRFKTTETSDAVFFEVMDELPEPFYSMTFADTSLEFDPACNDGFCAVGYAMNVRFKPHFYPSPQEKAIRGEVFREIGCRGAKLAVLAARVGKLREAMKNVNRRIDPNQMTLNAAGGAYAEDVPANYGTYTIVMDIDNPADMSEMCRRFRRYGVRQIDFHQGQAFVQGDMHFLDEKYGGSASVFRRKVTEPLKKAGFDCGLHTYAHFISVNCRRYTADPWAQKQLVRTETLTLSEDIGPDALLIPIAENASDISLMTGFRVKNSLYLLIEEEIVRYSAVSEKGITVERGVCGTVPAFHGKNTEIVHLAHMFGYFMPVLGSELFYEIARNTANAYNEGGFGMLYLDALDGLSMFEPRFGWYYSAQFVLEILKNVKRPPLLEYSTLYPLLWYSRSRIGAWDNACNGYQRFIREHIRFNTESPHAYGLPRQLGWYSLYPPMQYFDAHPGTNVKIMFREDVDEAGSRALSYNHGMSYNPLTAEALAKSPGFARNIERYAEYERLRTKRYFSDGAHEKLRDLNESYTLIGDEDSYVLVPSHYEKAKIYAGDTSRNMLCGINPYMSQIPVLRIEHLYTCKNETGIVLPTEAETKFDPPLDLTGNESIRVRVRGNGSSDSYLIGLANPFQRGGHTAYFEIPLDFEGIREYCLAENDCGEFAFNKYAGYKHRVCSESMGVLQFACISSMKVMKAGECKGAELLCLEAVPCVSEPITDPAIEINGASIIFHCTLKNSDYLEYRDGKACIYDWQGNERDVEAVEGKVEPLGHGSYLMHYSDRTHGTNARVRLTAGFFGSPFR